MQLKTTKLVFDISQAYGSPDSVGSFNRWFFDTDEGDAILAISGDSVSMFIKTSNNTWRSSVAATADEATHSELCNSLKKINARVAAR